MHQSETDMIERIFAATDNLMATVGLPNLSMHKIAKEAKISPGTIYIYFKNKDELLTQFARYIFKSFQQTLAENYDESLSFFQRYEQMWWNVWHFLHANPTITANMGQYESLPGFAQVCQEWEKDSVWHQFCIQAQQTGELADLPTYIMFSISLESALNVAYQCAETGRQVSTDVLESVIQRTWRAIQK